MARRAATFKQSDLTRALKGVKAAGIEIAKVTIGKDGSIEMSTGIPAITENEAKGNPWDTIAR